jgi:IS4 transposase
LLIDEIIELKNEGSGNKYPKRLRYIAIGDDEKKQLIELITKNFTWVAKTIRELYKSSWQIEIFIRKIKLLLHIKTFIGTGPNP